MYALCWTNHRICIIFYAAAYDAKADSKDLAARVVTQMLFTGKIDHLEEAYEISKKSHCVSGKLDRAVLVVRCHESLMKESVLSQEMQDTLEQLLIEQQDLPEVFSLAILQQYSRQKQLSEKSRHLCEQLLYAYCAKGIYMKASMVLKI